MKPSKVVKKAIAAVRKAGWVIADNGVIHAGHQPLDKALPFDYYGMAYDYMNEVFVAVVKAAGAKPEWKNEREVQLVEA